MYLLKNQRKKIQNGYQKAKAGELMAEDRKEQLKPMEIKKMQGIIEAILFTMGDSVELSRIASAIEHD